MTECGNPDIALLKQRVLKELQKIINVKDPLEYSISEKLYRSQADRKYFLIAFQYNSFACREILSDGFWKQVNYTYLPTKAKWGTDIVWFEFIGKHIQIIN